MRKGILITIAITAWTLMCIYGTYNNTVTSAEVTTVANGYEITYHNTNQTYLYDVDSCEELN